LGVLSRFLGVGDGMLMRMRMGDFPQSNCREAWNNRDPWKGWLVWDRAIYYGEDLLLSFLEWSGWLTARMP